MILPASYHTGFAPRDGYPVYPELWRGCVGAWAPCLGPTGLTLRDWSGRQNHGTLTNMVPGDDWVVNGGRYALDFDGVNDYVRTSISTPTFPFSFSVWCKPSSVHNGYIAGHFSSTKDGPTFNFETNSSGFFVLHAEDEVLGQHLFTSTVQYTPGTWYHLAAVMTSAASRSFYVNGVLQGTSTVSRIIDASINRFSLGVFDRPSQAIWFFGCIDDAFRYSRILTASEIRTLALRRGIAYEMYRPTYYTPPISARRRKTLTGQV